MSDTYHIQISVYVKADTPTGAKGGALFAKLAIEKMLPADSLDEVIIDFVGVEQTNESGNPLYQRT